MTKFAFNSAFTSFKHNITIMLIYNLKNCNYHESTHKIKQNLHSPGNDVRNIS